MKRYAVLAALALAGCDGGVGLPAIGGGGGSGGGGSVREFLVIGNSMTFEQCRARGGLIIRDANTTMIACDPQVRREPEPVDEFNNPANNPTG